MEFLKRLDLKRPVILLVIIFPIASYSCGYESCPQVKEGYINVHLVPHSHDDMGWLKTVDQYYYGTNNNIQNAGVQYILDSVVDELVKDSTRRFIYVETGFFWRWWTNQNEEKQNIVKTLVSSGQLEFISGGWCMNDEATAHYNAIIDQMTLGLRFLNDTFGSCAVPRVAWQIDPFGHSREQASLFAKMGFDGLFFGRLDYQDKHNREIKKTMEMIWSGSPKNLGKTSWLFTGVLFNGYNPPDGFCWDISCHDDPIMDDPKLLGYNLNNEVQRFIDAAFAWASVYRSNHVLMTLGSDFQYQAAGIWYKNLDKLISHVNSFPDTTDSPKINLIYSTPSCYLKEVNKAKIPFEVKRDDFFPYGSDQHSFWTGYFTSRPALKYYIHQTNNFLQACKNFGAIGPYQEETQAKVFLLSEALAIAQHHDAVAGTAKQHVTFDYALRLSRGIEACEKVIGTQIKQLVMEWNQVSEVKENESVSLGNIQFCHQLNVSSCAATETLENFLVHIYNPLARPVTNFYVRLPVSSEAWQVHGPQQGEVISSQVVPLPGPIFSIPGRNSTAHAELVFELEKIQPLSIQTVRVSRLHVNDINRPSKFRTVPMNCRNEWPWPEKKSFSNNRGLQITFDTNTGLLTNIAKKKGNGECVEIKLSQNFYFYTGMNGLKENPPGQSSGAYIFRPNGSEPILVSAKAEYSIKQGVHVIEIHQKFSSWVSQVIRLYQDADTVEFEYLIGPIPITDDIGKEVITKYTTDLKTDGVFFTDANGRELLKRERNVRPTWDYQVFEPVAGNYYPVNSRMILTEKKEVKTPGGEKSLILLNDRAQGGSSLQDGEMELMLHRRLLLDDGFGVGEALNEMAFDEGLVIRGKHWLLLAGEGTGTPTSAHRPIAQQIYRSPLLTFEEISGSISLPPQTNEIDENISAKETSTLHSNLTLTLPNNIHLLTYERLSEHQHLLRLEHFYEAGEDTALSKKAFVDVSPLQNILGFLDIRETTLGSNVWKNESHRMTWNPAEDVKLTNAEVTSKIVPYRHSDSHIEFLPMEIKTFILFFD